MSCLIEPAGWENPLLLFENAHWWRCSPHRWRISTKVSQTTLREPIVGAHLRQRLELKTIVLWSYVTLILHGSNMLTVCSSVMSPKRFMAFSTKGSSFSPRFSMLRPKAHREMTPMVMMLKNLNVGLKHMLQLTVHIIVNVNWEPFRLDFPLLSGKVCQFGDRFVHIFFDVTRHLTDSSIENRWLKLACYRLDLCDFTCFIFPGLKEGEIDVRTSLHSLSFKKTTIFLAVGVV